MIYEKVIFLIVIKENRAFYPLLKTKSQMSLLVLGSNPPPNSSFLFRPSAST